MAAIKKCKTNTVSRQIYKLANTGKETCINWWMDCFVALELHAARIRNPSGAQSAYMRRRWPKPHVRTNGRHVRLSVSVEMFDETLTVINRACLSPLCVLLFYFPTVISEQSHARCLSGRILSSMCERLSISPSIGNQSIFTFIEEALHWRTARSCPGRVSWILCGAHKWKPNKTRDTRTHLTVRTVQCTGSNPISGNERSQFIIYLHICIFILRKADIYCHKFTLKEASLFSTNPSAYT